MPISTARAAAKLRNVVFALVLAAIAGLTPHAAHAQAAPDNKKTDQAGKPTPAADTAAAQADDKNPPAVNAGRPTITDPAGLTAPGWLEAEFGVFKNLDRDRNLGTPLLLKLTSKNRRMQYRLENDGYIRLGDTRADGIGDTNLALQYLFATQEKNKWDISGRVNLKLPTARPAIGGTKKADFSTLFLASKDFTPQLHVDFNAGLASMTRVEAPGADVQLFLSASLTTPFRGNRWAYTNEICYFSPIQGQRAAVTTMHGFTYAVHRYDAYDIAVQWQLQGDGAVFQVLFGRTFFFGRLF